MSLDAQPVGDDQMATTPKLTKNAKMVSPAADQLVENTT